MEKNKRSFGVRVGVPLHGNEMDNLAAIQKKKEGTLGRWSGKNIKLNKKL